MKKKTVIKKPTTAKKIINNNLTKTDFLNETEKISSLLCALKSEMTEKFEKHENIILAEYRHRIETLETKVRELQARG